MSNTLNLLRLEFGSMHLGTDSRAGKRMSSFLNVIPLVRAHLDPGRLSKSHQREIRVIKLSIPMKLVLRHSDYLKTEQSAIINLGCAYFANFDLIVNVAHMVQVAVAVAVAVQTQTDLKHYQRCPNIYFLYPIRLQLIL